ncbi:SDR family NAD(P)-dependent oxidoreductase [Glaciecola sp. 2405UD65-10]|uniref:SDR family NAD(P)-dependent oxidoreductase n=1 Tax=Glaciecola sp. 2405UD65-10 TaxID=3397244 RepID=UPI003B5AF7F6
MSTLLITGATSGLGEALTKEAIENGHTVIACGRNADKLSNLNSLTNVSTLQFDATNEEETLAALKNVEFDIAVINAGTCEYLDIDDIDPSLFKRVFDINFFGAINTVAGLAPSFTPGMKLVFVDSMARLLPFTKSQAYGASKAALHYACKSFEVDLANKGITVQSISPGFVETPLTEKNEFDMPMAISAQKAAKYMLKGIMSDHSSVYFPRRFGIIMRLLNILPESFQSYICKKMIGEESKGSTNKSKESNDKDAV